MFCKTCNIGRSSRPSFGVQINSLVPLLIDVSEKRGRERDFGFWFEKNNDSLK